MTHDEILDFIKITEIPFTVRDVAHSFFAASQESQSYSQTTVDTIECMTPPLRNVTNTEMLCPPGTTTASCRSFRNQPFPQAKLLTILGKSFTKGATDNHRAYASAGGLYPVIPLLVVLNSNALEGVSEGTYGIDMVTNRLTKLRCPFNPQKIKDSIFPAGAELVSSMFLCYTFSLERALIKYGVRGIRHTFIEIGEMSQTFRLFGQSIIPDFGDVSWSGFDDTGLAAAMGLKRLQPGMVQFFGLKMKKFEFYRKSRSSNLMTAFFQTI